MKTQDVFIAHPRNLQQINALKAFMQALEIKFETTKEKPYNPEFVKKIQKSKEEYEKGEFISVEKNDIKKFLGLE